MRAKRIRNIALGTGALLLWIPIGHAQELTRLGQLPASFSGVLPCADCPGIRYGLNLFPDGSYFLRMTYLERSVKPFDQIGRWVLSNGGATLALLRGSQTSEQFAVVNSDALRKLDMQGHEIESKNNYDLRRTGQFERIDPQLEMRGMFRYMADAASFTECQTGQRWPVAMEKDYKTLERAYTQTRKQPGEDLLVTLDGQVALRPDMEGAKQVPTLIVDRYAGIWPGETCGAPLATSPLQETYWKLTRLEGKPVTVAERQREPYLILRSEKDRVNGSGGCNNFTGTYSLNGNELALKGVAATMMACVQGMEQESAFFKVLDKVRQWKISGEHLELSDDNNTTLATLEARALR